MSAPVAASQPERSVHSSCHHLRGPARHELFQTVKCFAEVLSGRGKTETEMRGRVETVSGREQDSALGGGLAEGTGVLSAHQPRESRHSAPRADPVENVGMSGHKAIQLLEILAGGFLRLPENDGVVADGDFRKNLARGVVADRKIG